MTDISSVYSVQIESLDGQIETLKKLIAENHKLALMPPNGDSDLSASVNKIFLESAAKFSVILQNTERSRSTIKMIEIAYAARHPQNNGNGQNK